MPTDTFRIMLVEAVVKNSSLKLIHVHIYFIELHIFSVQDPSPSQGVGSVGCFSILCFINVFLAQELLFKAK